MSNRRPPGANTGLYIAWRAFQLLTMAAFAYTAWRLLWHSAYRIDIDVYRMGGRAWLDSHPLYAGGTTFHTQGGLDLPFTYPPLAAIAFSPFAWLPLPVASTAITLTTLLLLVVSTTVVLSGLGVWPDSRVASGAAWVRRAWLAAAIVAPAVIYLEPIRSNFEFGQINVVLMTLVIADCVPRRTRWPRGILLGLAIALKLTPAVFLVYFVLRRDTRAALTALASFVAATATALVLAWGDSLEYWTHTVRNTDRIGTATLNTNQNISAALARLGLGEGVRFAVWTLACFAMLALTVWACRRILRATQDSENTAGGGEPVLALICIALFGLVVSPVSWSHHWVWALPTVVVTAVLAWRRRDAALTVVTAAGLALMIWTPIVLLPEHHETDATWWRQLVGGSYVWWAVLVVAVAGMTATVGTVSPPRSRESEPAAALVRPAHPA